MPAVGRRIAARPPPASLPLDVQLWRPVTTLLSARSETLLSIASLLRRLGRYRSGPTTRCANFQRVS